MFTQTDLENVERAIVALATGKRVVQVRVDDQVIEYAQADLEDLKALKKEISQVLMTNASSGPVRFVRTVSRKGVY